MPLPRRLACTFNLFLLSTITLTACSSDEIQAPPDATEGTLTVDASAGWAFASLEDEATVTVADPSASTAWDIAFSATRVMLNGGAAGPGDVLGYCVCQNAGASDAEILGFTPEGEAGDFEQVTAADVPESGAFEAEALVPAIRGWYGGEGAAAVAAGTTWLLRLQDGISFAKLRVVSLDGPSDGDAGGVTLEYAVQPAADQAFAPAQTVALNAGAGAGLDLNTGSTTPDEASWDLRLEGFTIRLNGGVSGPGDAAAATTTESFDAVTTASVDSRAYQQDSFAGVFSSHPWYRYNLTGENIIHPTFDVYLVRRGSQVYKLQLIDYYGPAGEPRRITFRYAHLAE